MSAVPRIDPESIVARIIAELQANPDAQVLLLRALLTNEFLGMPVRLQRVEADIAELKADVAVLKADVAVLKTDVAVLKTDVAVLKSDVAVLKADVAVLKTDVAVLKTDVATLKGDSLEVKLHRKIRPLLSRKLGLRRARMMQSPVQDTSPELYEPVEAALDTGVVDDAQEIRISATDIILRARRKADQAPVWVAVEVSNRVERHDIERARRSADALGMVFEVDTVAAVAGYRLDVADRARAASAGVEVFLVEEAA